MTSTHLAKRAAYAAALALVIAALPAHAQRPSPTPHSVLQVFADHARSEKTARAIGMFSVGAAATGAGLAVDVGFDHAYGRVLWAAGLAGIAVGGLTLLLPTPLELLAQKHAAAGGNDAVERLERDWKRVADVARIGRLISGWISMTFAAGAVVTGAAFAAGAGHLDRDARSGLSLGLILAGGAMAGSGALSLLDQSDVEKGYRAAFASDSAQASEGGLRVTFAALPSGAGFIGFRGRL